MRSKNCRICGYNPHINDIYSHLCVYRTADCAYASHYPHIRKVRHNSKQDGLILHNHESEEKCMD